MKQIPKYFIKLFAVVALILPCQTAVGETLNYGMKIRFIGSNDPANIGYQITSKELAMNCLLSNGNQAGSTASYCTSTGDDSVWIILDPNSPISTEPVNFNTPFLLKNVRHSSLLKCKRYRVQTIGKGSENATDYQWLIIDPQNQANRGVIKLEDKIALRSHVIDISNGSGG